VGGIQGGAGQADGYGATVLRVVVVDDHEVLRTGTRQVLETVEDIAVVGEAGDARTALGMTEELEPDVVLLDVRLPDMDGIELATKLASAHPGACVVILSAFDDDEYVRAALSAGVSGYLLKSMPGAELIAAVRAAALGTMVLDPTLSARLARGPSRLSLQEDPARLTLREREIVRLVAEGLSNKAIAGRLGVSVRTVEGHLNHVFSKLGLSSRTELVRYALAHDLASHRPPVSH
jgi:two-component system, NarL family, response regulator DevR